jgi:hypothetical protein
MELPGLYSNQTLLYTAIQQIWTTSMPNKDFACRVCGYIQDELPWGNDGKTPIFEICVCCGTEFGYNDATIRAVKKYRETWLSEGAKWFKPKFKPRDWDLEEQMLNIPGEFL